MPTADALTMHDAVWAKLNAITGVNAYDGEVPKTPPLDPDGRVHAYAVLYGGLGATLTTSLDGAQGALLANFYVTCVGGDPTRRAWCVKKVREGLTTSVTLSGRSFPIRAREDEPASGRDDDVVPPRHWAQPEFQVFAP